MTSIPRRAFCNASPQRAAAGEAASRAYLSQTTSPPGSRQPSCLDVKLGVGELQTQTNKSASDRKRSRSQGGQG